MKLPALFIIFLIPLALFAQEVNSSASDKSNFSTNLGVQEIVEVGAPLTVAVDINQSEEPDLDETVYPTPVRISEPIPGTPLGSLKNSPPLAIPRPENGLEAQFKQIEDSSKSESAPSAVSDNSKALNLDITAQVGLRTYRTSNVLRQKSSLAENSGVFESSVGMGVSGSQTKLGEYVTMIPGIDLFMQWANFEEYSGLLDYRFAMAKGDLQFGLPKDFTVGVSLDYNVLYNLKSGDRAFDSISPSLSIQKLFPLTEESFLILETMIRWSDMTAVNIFPAAGIFADSGNNYQNSLSLSYIHSFGENKKWTLMPRVSINRTNYSVSPNLGRLDYLFSGGASLIYQWNEWFGVQAFWTYFSMDSDSIDDFNAQDLGIAVSGNYQF